MTLCPIIDISSDSLPADLQSVATTRWQRISEAHPKSAQRLHQHLRLGPSCARVLSISEWIAQALVADEDLIDALIADIDSARERHDLKTLLQQQLPDDTDQPQAMQRLRTFRRREMVRITWRDLAGWASLPEVLNTLSSLADTCVATACDLAHHLTARRFGQPALVDGEPPSLIVLGLGKLGGSELNLSSDIDLIFCYSGDGETNGERSLSHQEYFTRVGQLLIQLLSNVTEDGFVFRVDMRLRPNGDSGPLVLNFDSMEHYYQAHGRDWERYALVKARVLTGSARDRDDIMGRLKPFVYRRYLDYRAFDAIRDMRRMILAEIRGDVERDVKRGTGGIRQIEFIIQTLQLVRGGRLPSLQTPHWSVARDVLVSEILLQPDIAESLTEAYEFLRRVEHRLQAVRDEQTHLLPSDDESRLRLAFAMHFADVVSFERAITRHRQTVNDCFSEHFSEPEDTDASQGETSRSTTNIDAFDDPDTIALLLDQATQGRHYNALTSDARAYLERLLPLILNEAIETPHPQTCVRRLLDVVQSIGRRTSYFALLVEEPVILHRLARLVSTSSWFSRWIGQYPVLLDTLLNPPSPEALRDPTELRADLQRALTRADSDDLESAMATLREFHHGQILQIAAADIDAKLNSDQVGDALTLLATNLLDGCIQVAANDLNIDADALCVVGYGRLGSGEMNYSSDLDLVFLFDDNDDVSAGTDDQVAVERARGRLIRRVIHVMTTRTEAGDVYELDMRLRPNGRSGTLVTTVGAFKTYQLNEAWPWEHQALVRASPVCGSAALRAKFNEIRAEILCTSRDTTELQTQIKTMRQRMLSEHQKKDSSVADIDLKLSPGGLVDIEFIVQYMVLCHAPEHPDLVTTGTTKTLLERLHANALLNAEQFESLASTHDVLIHHSRRLALMESGQLDQSDVESQDITHKMHQTRMHWNALMQDSG